jgi:hypothetical protein
MSTKYVLYCLIVLNAIVSYDFLGITGRWSIDNAQFKNNTLNGYSIN